MSVMNTPARAAFALFFLILSACSGSEDETTPPAETVASGQISISNAWIRPAADGARMSAGYGMISNAGDEADRITALSSQLADAVELHESREVDGRATMRPVNGLEIPPGGSVMLEPGGYHVMLIGLTGEIAEGKTYDVTLTFEKAGDITVPMTATAGGGMMGADH